MVEESVSTGSLLLRLLAVLLLVGLNGFFVAAEFALVGARSSRLDQLAEEGRGSAKLARYMQSHLDRYIAASQLGITVASLLLGVLGEETFALLIEPPVARGLQFILGDIPQLAAYSETISTTVGFAIAIFIITTLHIVLGEQAPKVFAIRSAEETSLFVARPLQIFNRLFGIIIRFLDWLTNVVLRLFGVRGQTGHHGPPTLAELRMMVQASGKGGVIEEGEQALLINVFDFGSRAAYQVMVPRTDVKTIDHDATVRGFLALFRETGHTRFPVLGEGGIDDVIGIISAKELLVTLSDGSTTFDDPIRPIVKPAFFTPDTKRIGELMHEMQKQRQRMAVLVDEYGGMAGIITQEDLVEEIVGELDDELDTNPDDIREIDSQHAVVEGSARIEDVNDELELHLPSGEYETIAGFILEQLGRLPQVNEAIHHDSVVLTVLEMQGPRIASVEIRRD
jgi:CBS domain containing-hemolysin-like protein